MVNTTDNTEKKTLTLKNKVNKENSQNSTTDRVEKETKSNNVNENKVNLLEVKKIVYEQFEVLREFKPLAIKDILEQVLSYNKTNDKISRRSLRRFLRIHVNTYKYLKNILSYDCRYNLDGTKAEGEKGVISEQAKKYSQELIEKQEKIFAEKKAKMAMKKKPQNKKFSNKKPNFNKNNSYKKYNNSNNSNRTNYQNKNSNYQNKTYNKNYNKTSNTTPNVVYRSSTKRTFGENNSQKYGFNKLRTYSSFNKTKELDKDNLEK